MSDMTERKFFRTVFQVEVLSEDLIDQPALKDLDYMITEGDCSGVVKRISQKTLNGRQAAKALISQASNPGFFNLTDKGEDATGVND
jgi:hypothetical protein